MGPRVENTKERKGGTGLASPIRDWNSSIICESTGVRFKETAVGGRDS
jgi:hypothetical protein